ncbi:MAG: hypothetical protein ACRELY_07335, partial [Polyangiaceae bacterium]
MRVRRKHSRFISSAFLASAAIAVCSCHDRAAAISNEQAAASASVDAATSSDAAVFDLDASLDASDGD